MRFIVLYIILFFTVTAPQVAIAQSNFKFSSYTVDDGLPQSSIWSILQDRNGFLWVATSDGLCRFDGYEFNVFRSKDGDTNSIAGKSVIHLFEDVTGDIWIVHDKGITRYDIKANRFINIYYYDNLPQSEILNRILGQDKDGNIWVGVMNAGLMKIDTRNNRIAETIAGDSIIANDEIWHSGFIDSEQRIWFTKYTNGLFCYNILRHKFEKYLDRYPGNAIVPYGVTGLLMASNDELVLFDRNTHVYTVIDQTHWDEQLRVKNEVYNIAIDNKSHYWLCNRRGAYVFDTAKRKVIKRFSSYSQGTNNYSFTHTAYCDRSGNMWIGTNGDGLKKLMNDTKGFRTYNTHKAGASLVKSIYVHDSILYSGCFENGVDVFSMDTGFIKKIDVKDKQGASWFHMVYAFGDLDNNNALMYSSDLRGCNIGLFNFRTHGFTSLLPQLTKDMPMNGYCGNATPFIIKTHKGPVFDWNNSLLLVTGNAAENIHFKELHDFKNERLSCAFETHDGRIYVGTYTGFYYQNSNLQWTKGALPGVQLVKTICEDASGNIWLGTPGGIYVLNTQHKLLCHYDVSNGLKNEFIYGILRDKSGRMWFSHNKGISMYDPVSKGFHHYTSEDGLQSNEFNTGAYFQMPNGTMLFGGINGVNAFNPDSVKSNPNKPALRITGIRIFDELLMTDTAYWYMHMLTLPYERNSVTIDFSALEFTNPGQNLYEYMMEGLDNKWIKAGVEHRARYPALPPGTYTFKVKAANNDGIWQDVPTTLQITIVPPFWQQWWFRVVYVLLAIGCISGIMMWLQRQRHRRQIRELELQQKIQLERERISRDLHDNVGTQLSLISNNIEWISHPLKEITEHEKADKLQFVNDAARGIIATLRETIWALNKEQISLEEFSDKLKGFVQRQLALYPQTQLIYNEEIDEDVILGPSEALNLFRICQEAVANALKYAEAAILDIRVQSVQGKYKIIISDNGKGFDIKTVDPSVHNGLENMKFRTNDINCRLDIISATGKGTMVTVAKK